MRPLSGWVPAIIVVSAMAALAACAASRETRFYVLTPLSAVERNKEASGGRPPVIGVRPVGLPEHLDRPEIVIRTGENMLHLAEFDQWAASLRDNVTRVLAEDLSLLVPAERVLVFPWVKDGSVELEVIVEVARLEGVLGGVCSLTADWAVFRKGGKEPAVTGRSSHSESASDSYAALVAAESKLIAGLARDITAALRTVSR